METQAKKQARTKQKAKKADTKKRFQLRFAYTEDSVLIALPYEVFQKLFDNFTGFGASEYHSQMMALLFIAPEKFAKGGIRIEVSYEALGYILSYVESRYPRGVEGFIENCGEIFSDSIGLKLGKAITAGLRQLVKKVLIKIAPKIKKGLRETAPNVNNRRVRRFIEMLNAISANKPIPEKQKATRKGRPTKASIKLQQAERKEKSRKLFQRHKKADAKQTRN